MSELERDLTRKLAQRDEEIARLKEENRLLREKLDLVIRQLFGKKSERLDPAQLELLLGDGAGESILEEPGKAEASAVHPELAEAVEEVKPTAKCRAERRPRIPENLPVEHEQVIVPEAVKACPEAWRRIGEEVSEQLDYQPGHFLRRRTIRPKYVRRTAGKEQEESNAPLIAPLPPKLIDGGVATSGLLAHIIISKYCDHLPLYRQCAIFRQRHGVEISRASMSRWVEHVADWLKPVYHEIRNELFQGGYVQVDETPLKYLKPGAGKTHQGYLWAYRAPRGDTLFDWHGGRGHQCLENIVPHDFSGVLQCDGYRAYQTFAEKHGGAPTLAACWAHARRKFHEALELGDHPQRCAWLLNQIRQLYLVERELRESRAGPRLRQAVRASRSRPIVERIRQALQKLKMSRRHLPRSPLGKAIDYALGQWVGLTVFLGNGMVEIDNNLIENAIRPTKLGAKNWLFIGAKEAGWRSSVIYTIIESCRNRRIDPHCYLRDVLERLPSMTNHQIKGVTPKAWAEHRAEKSKRRAS